MKRLTDAYLAEALELAEFQQKKNALTSEKKTLEEKLSDFERKGNRWFELTRNWILEANQAKNLALQEDFSGMKNFLKKIGLNRQISQQKLSITFKKPFNFLAKMPAEARGEGEDEAEHSSNSIWWTRGDSNPGFIHAMDVCYHYTTGPFNYRYLTLTPFRFFCDLFLLTRDNNIRYRKEYLIQYIFPVF